MVTRRLGTRSAATWRPTLHRVLVVLAVGLLFVYGLIGAGWVTSSRPDAWLGFGLASFAASFV
jgi:hypothetical protein